MTLDDLTEKQWQKQVVDLAVQLGFKRAYHTFDSRRSHPGFPDLVLVRDRIIFAELKREPRVSSPVSDAQKEWLDALAAAGGECYLWRPSDLDEIAGILSKRWRYEHADASLVGTWTTNEIPRLWPQSIWLALLGRRDRQQHEKAA